MGDDGGPSQIFRAVWKGSGTLAHGRALLRADEYTRMLGGVGWRDLGLLLVRLLQPLDDTAAASRAHQTARGRCLAALATTIVHMQTAEFSSAPPVNTEFVSRCFASLGRSAALISACPGIAPAVFRAVASALAASTRDPPRFDPNAVVQGLVGGSPEPTSSGRGPKRRRVLETAPGFISMLADLLDDGTQLHTHRYIIRALRAQNGMLAKHASHEQAFRIIQALIGQGLDAAQPSTAADELRAGDVFACLRDMLSASSTSSLDGAKATDFQLGVRLLKTLCDIFRPYLTGSKSIYAFCAEKRHRCYQWTAMCRLGTWILLRTQTEPAPIECSRLCWLQIHRMDPAADLQVWGLLLNESLGHIASSKGVLLANLDAQSRMFSALAPLFTRIIQSVPALSANKLARALVLKALGACDTLLRLIPPHAASMGLFNPGSRAPVEEGTFAQLKCTAVDYVFRPPPAPDSGSSSPSSTNGYDSNSDDSNDPIAEQRHEESDEFDREGRLCEMLAAFVTLANYITLGADGDGMRSVLAMAVRSSLQWISTLAMSARDNANKQVRLLETRRRVNIGVVGEHTRLIAFATDWSRLQRIPVIRHRESSDDTPAKRTYKDTAAQVVRLLASVPVWSILGDDCQPILERCLGRASDDDPASRPFEGVRFCHNLSALLSPGDLLQAAFLALRTLSSILGVHSQLASGNITRLRLPQLQVRGYSPKSDEAFMQLAVQTGLCELLLVPSFVDRCTAFVAHCEEDTNGYSLVLRAGQIWLDMIGSIARHSLFRTHIGIACGTSPSAAGDGRLQFHVWWIRALAMGTDCLVGALASPGDMDRIRLACILPAHLLSWHKYLPATPGFVERFAGLKAPLVTEDAQQPRQSAISVIYFLACRLWYQLRLLDPELGDDPATLRVGRDVWGISSDALGMLQGLVRFLAARRLLRDLGLLEDLGCLVSDLMADQNTPQLIARLIHLPESPAATPTICHDDDPLVHPLLQIYEFSDGDDDDTSGGSAASEDVVGKLLRDFDQNQTPSTTQRPLQEYYRPRVLSRLWSEFTTNLVVLPAAISLGSLASGPRLSERKADVIEWLSDADDIFFCAFTPLLAVREHLAEPSPLWRAVGKGLQFADVSSSLELVPISDHTFPRLCVSAALVVPELQQVRLPDSPCAMVCTVAGQLAAHSSHDRRCRTALLFLAWRQRKSLGGHLRQGTDHLRQAAMHILGEMPSSASLLSEQPIVVRGRLDDSEPSGPIATSMAFLVEHSPVFGAMFTGPFSEARLARDGQQVFELLADHTALHTLLRILHNCAQQQSIVGLEDDDDEGLLARLLDGRLGLNEVVRVLELAVLYDLRPVIVLLVWRIARELSEQPPWDLSTDALTALASMFAEAWEAHYPGAKDAEQAARRLLAAVTVLHLDQVEPPLFASGNPWPHRDSFPATVASLFAKPSVA